MNIKYDELVLSGGHIYGLAFLGALKKLELGNINRIIGSH